MGGGPKKKNSDDYLTVCKLCGEGIYKSDERYWQRLPPMGLIHARCIPLPPEKKQA